MRLAWIIAILAVPVLVVLLSIRQGQGESPAQAQTALKPIPLQTHALFNPAFDCVHFLLAALVPTVLQILVAAGTAYAISLDFGPGRDPRGLVRLAGGLLPAMLGKILPYTALFLLILGLSDVALFGRPGVPLRGSLPLMAAGAVLFVLAAQLIGALAFVATRSMRPAASILSVITAPAFGFMGLGFPREVMSWVAQGWSALIPGISYVQLRIDQSPRATPVEISVWPVLWLALIAIGLAGLALGQMEQLHRTVEVPAWGRSDARPGMNCVRCSWTAMLIAEMPELGRMTSGEAAAMTGLAPAPHDSGAMRGKRAIAGGRRSLRQVLFQAALAAACHNPVLKPVAQRLGMRGKPYKLAIIAIARGLVTIANAILKTGAPWRQNPIM